MNTASRWGACLVVAALSAASFANEGAGARDTLVQQQTMWMERYPDTDGRVDGDATAGAAIGERLRPDEPRSTRVASTARATDADVVNTGDDGAVANSEDQSASFEER